MSDEEGGNAYLVNGNMIPVSLADITAFLVAASAVQAENADAEPAENTPDEEETPPAGNSTSQKQQKSKGWSAP